MTKDGENSMIHSFPNYYKEFSCIADKCEATCCAGWQIVVDEESLKKYLPVHDLGMDLSREMNLFVISGLSSLMISWHADGFQKTPHQMAGIAYRMLSEPLLIHI
jgi:hypothetical protein